MLLSNCYSLIFFFNDTATTEIYTLSLHDALPISSSSRGLRKRAFISRSIARAAVVRRSQRKHSAAATSMGSSRDRKSTRLNSSHANISYAVFCLKKKKNNNKLPGQSTITYHNNVQ